SLDLLKTAITGGAPWLGSHSQADRRDQSSNRFPSQMRERAQIWPLSFDRVTRSSSNIRSVRRFLNEAQQAARSPILAFHRQVRWSRHLTMTTRSRRRV